jgi:hypothetical protein
MRRALFSLQALLLATMPVAAQSPTVVQPTIIYSKPGQSLKPTDRPVYKGAADSLVSFDYRRADLRWVKGRWQVTVGDALVKDFGAHQAEARDALQLIRGLRLTQHGTVGTPEPVIEFWLSEGRAPQSTMLGLRPISFDRTSLHLEQIQGAWCLRDNHEVLFNFQGQQDLAQRTLAVVQRYGFDQVGYVGQAAPSMMYFLGGGYFSDARMSSPSSIVSRRHEKPRDPATATTSPFFKGTRTAGDELGSLSLTPVGRLLRDRP